MPGQFSVTINIVAHAELGLLFLEVKGGRISCRENDGQWISTNRNDIRFNIKNPIDQARSSKHHFVKRLKKERALRHKFITARHAAILPGSQRPRRALAADAPLELLAFGDDMPRLGAWVMERMHSDRPPAEALGPEGMSAVKDVLRSHFELRSHIGVSLAEDSKRIQAMTSEQASILDSLEDNPQQAIAGGAGTGKTVLAIEKAQRSAEAGRRTLLVCYNSPLAAYLERLTKGVENLVVRSLHRLCVDIAADADLPQTNSIRTYEYSDPKVDLLIEAVDKSESLKFDTIVIDEGQDFRDTWMDALKMSLVDMDESEFYVFYDDNQSLYENESSFIASLPRARYRLTRNLRNTRRIHNAMQPWYRGKATRAVGPEGSPVERLEVRHADRSLEVANERIAHLVRSGQLEPNDIAVLTGAKLDPMNRPREIAGVRVSSAAENKPGTIVFDTVRRFKGLSKPCVFIIHPDGLVGAELRYVALSRANILLAIVGTSESISVLLNQDLDVGLET